ncbi:hypothetical protein WMY93_032867, partial [Mugilogobius chulae]
TSVQESVLGQERMHCTVDKFEWCSWAENGSEVKHPVNSEEVAQSGSFSARLFLPVEQGCSNGNPRAKGGPLR